MPSTFLAFCVWLGVTLSLGQTVIAKVAYDGVQPAELEGDERAFARQIFGDVETVDEAVRSTFVAVCGGRGGKSYVLVALRLVWGMYMRDLSSLAPGQHPAALVVAPNHALRQEVVNYAIGAIRSHPELRDTLIVPKGTGEDDVVGSFSIRRPDGPIVDFVAGVATRGGYAARGRSWTDAALDECAFFRDASFKVNDKDIYDAASPRVLPGGQTLVASTPWAQAGLLFDLWQTNWGKPTGALVAHASTLTLNPSPWARKIVELGTKKDPENAAREYGAQFMSTGTTVFFPPGLIEACIDETLDVLVPRMPKPGDAVAAGGDLGFRSDSSALAITHLVPEGQVLLGELVEERPVEGKPLKPSLTIKKFAERMAVHGVTAMMGDQHYRETADEHLEAAGLAFVDAPATPDEVFVRARQKMREGVLRFARHDRLIRQMKEVMAKPLPGGRLQIILPQWAKGGHGDLVSAYVLGVWQLVADVVAPPKPREGSQEWADAARRARAEEYQAAQDRPHWMPPAAADRGANAHWRRR